MRDAADWLLSVQNGDGGWEFTTGDARSSADITGAVIQALRYAGRAGTQAEQRALAFLRTMQQDDGGFQYSEAVSGSNTASTAWAVQGLWAAGIDPASWEQGGRDPLDYLRAMQQADGEILWKQGPDGGHQHDLDDRLRGPGLRGHDLAAGVRPASGQARIPPLRPTRRPGPETPAARPAMGMGR